MAADLLGVSNSYEGVLNVKRVVYVGTSILVLALLLLTVGASPPQPTYGTAVVDGNISEWDLTNDLFGSMYRAFKTTQPQEANYYLRYSCATQTMYVLVQVLPGVEALEEPANAWATISGITGKVYTGADAGNISPPQFAWVGPFGTNTTLNETTATGYEASFNLAPGSYTIVVHVEVFDSGGAQTAGSAGSGDSLVISCTGKASPTISTTLSASSITVGGSVYDTATLNGATSTAGGTVTYTVYTDSGCTQNAQTAGTVNVTNGSVPSSNSITFNSAGTFYWQAMYSGDSNNNGATSTCITEQLTVNPAGTAPSIYDPKTVSLFKDKYGDGKVHAGDILLYTVTITNNGNAVATGVTYNDTVDPHTSLFCSGPDAPTTSQGSISNCNPGPGGSLTVAIGDIAAGVTVTITYKVEVESGNFNIISNQGETTGTNFTPVLTDNPNTPAPHDPTVISVSPPPTVGGDPPIYKNIVVFPTPEWALGKDLNGDGDTDDTVLRYMNLETGKVINTGIPVSGMTRSVDIYEDTVVFVLQESSFLNFSGAFNLLATNSSVGPIGTFDLRTGRVQMTGAWGYRPTIYKNIISISGNTVRYYDLNTGRLVDTGIPGQNQALWGRKIAYQHAEIKGPPLIYIYDIDTGSVINTGEPGSSPAVYGNIVVFMGNDMVIRYYDMSTQTLFDTGEEGNDPAIYGRRIVFASGNHIRYFDIDSGRAYDTGKSGLEPSIYQDTITYYVWESPKGMDLVGAGDRLRPIVKTHQISDSDRLLPKKSAPPRAGTTLNAFVKLSIDRVLSRPQAHGIRFVVHGAGVESMEVEVYDLGGRRVFVSGFQGGTNLYWSALDTYGRPLANGVYLYLITARAADGKMAQSRIQRLLVLR